MKSCRHAHMGLLAAYAHPLCRCICTAAHTISGEVTANKHKQHLNSCTLVLVGLLQAACQQLMELQAAEMADVMSGMRIWAL